MKKALLFLIALSLLALIASFPVNAGEIEPNFKAYLETLGEDEYASAIVYLIDRPDIRALDNQLRAEKAAMAERHSQVIDALKQAAQ